MKKENLKGILRIDKKTKEEILFFPEEKANKYKISYYAFEGEHGEASIDYYYSTKPFPNHEKSVLIPFYERHFSINNTIKIVPIQRLSKKMKKEIWE